MDKFHVIAPYLFPIILILVGALVINVALIAIVVSFIKNRFEGDYPEGGTQSWLILRVILYLGLSYLFGLI